MDFDLLKKLAIKETENLKLKRETAAKNLSKYAELDEVLLMFPAGKGMQTCLSQVNFYRRQWSPMSAHVVRSYEELAGVVTEKDLEILEQYYADVESWMEDQIND